MTQPVRTCPIASSDVGTTIFPTTMINLSHLSQPLSLFYRSIKYIERGNGGWVWDGSGWSVGTSHLIRTTLLEKELSRPNENEVGRMLCDRSGQRPPAARADVWAALGVAVYWTDARLKAAPLNGGAA